MNFALSWGLAIFLTVAVQSSLVHFISYQGIKADFVLIFVAFAGILHGRTHGMVIGFFCGLLLDLLNTGLFGFNTVFLFFAGMAAGMIRKKVFEDSILLPLTLILSFSIAQQLCWNLLLVVSGYVLSDMKMLFFMSITRVIYNTVVTLPLIFVFNKINRVIG